MIELPMITITDLLLLAYELNASDLHIAVGAVPMLRVQGSLMPVGNARLTASQAVEMARTLLGSERLVHFHNHGEALFTYELGDFGRFRVHVYKQRGDISISARVIPLRIPAVTKLNLPESLLRLTERSQGLILVSGLAGSGKSTTIAALVDHMNQTSSRHIVTLEQPIEYVHTSSTSLVQHREVGCDAGTYPSGIQAAIRQDCDVIVMDQIKDHETMQAVFMAIETGHLVIAEVPAFNVINTIEHVIELYPDQLQSKARLKLSAGLAGVMSQRLFLQRESKERCCATELLLVTSAAADLIRLNEMHQLNRVMQTDVETGMHTMDMSIMRLMEEGRLERSESGCQ